MTCMISQSEPPKKWINQLASGTCNPCFISNWKDFCTCNLIMEEEVNYKNLSLLMSNLLNQKDRNSSLRSQLNPKCATETDKMAIFLPRNACKQDQLQVHWTCTM